VLRRFSLFPQAAVERAVLRASDRGGQQGLPVFRLDRLPWVGQVHLAGRDEGR
jgi:hypothetical protein